MFLQKVPDLAILFCRQGNPTLTRVTTLYVASCKRAYEPVAPRRPALGHRLSRSPREQSAGASLTNLQRPARPNRPP